MKKILYIHFFLLFLLITVTSIASSQVLPQLQKRYQIALRQLNFATDVLITFPTPAARTIIREAEKNLKIARQMADAGRYAMARTYLETAERLIQKALVMILSNPLQLQRDKLDQLLERAESLLAESRNRRANEFLQRALESRSNAERALQTRQYQFALEQFRLATYMANRSIQLSGSGSVQLREKLQNEQTQLEQLFKQAQSAIDRHQNPTAIKFYRLAEKQAKKIDNFIRKNDYQRALENYQQATRLLLRAIDIAADNPQSKQTSIYEEVAALDELIESMNSNIEALSEKDNPRLRFLYQQIRNNQQKTHQALENRDFKATLFLAQVTRKLVERALQILNRRKGDNYAQRVESEFQQLDVTIQNLKHQLKQTPSPEADELLKMARRTRNQAEKLYNRNNIPRALASIAIANHIVMQAEDILAGTVSPENAKNLSQEIDASRNRLVNMTMQTGQRGGRLKLFIREITDLLDKAERYLEQGYLHASRECITIANRYLDRASRF